MRRITLLVLGIAFSAWSLSYNEAYKLYRNGQQQEAKTALLKLKIVTRSQAMGDASFGLFLAEDARFAAPSYWELTKFLEQHPLPEKGSPSLWCRALEQRRLLNKKAVFPKLQELEVRAHKGTEREKIRAFIQRLKSIMNEHRKGITRDIWYLSLLRAYTALGDFRKAMTYGEAYLKLMQPYLSSVACPADGLSVSIQQEYQKVLLAFLALESFYSSKSLCEKIAEEDLGKLGAKISAACQKQPVLASSSPSFSLSSYEHQGSFEQRIASVELAQKQRNRGKEKQALQNFVLSVTAR